ncbi:MAG: TAXI family TRAP transporter solute-binding subunit [Fuerstiella sp.]
MADPKEKLKSEPEIRPARRGSFAFALVVIGVLSLICFYWFRTRLPDTIRIAGGPEGGRYSQLANALADELRLRLDVEVDVVSTKGSMENISLMESCDVQLALYQPETIEILQQADQPPVNVDHVRFISNLYPEYLLPIQSVVGDQVALADPSSQVWSCNDRMSGDFAMATLLMRHLGRSHEDVDVRSVPYGKLQQHLSDQQIGIGIVCCGLQAPVLKDVLNETVGQLVQVPAVDALADRNLSLELGTIPQGFFSTAPMIPSQDYQTVSLQAQLLARDDTSIRLVEEVTEILMDAGFQRQQGLAELFNFRLKYATESPEFEMHVGASHVFFPDLKPLVNPDFVEGTEGLRSFFVSLAVAIWLLHRWWVRREALKSEHQLDRYIRDVLLLEEQQMEIDGEGGPEEAAELQTMLDKVTLLRKEALAEFTAHELNEDRATECLIGLCHALSDKINAKLTRHTLAQLTHAIQSSLKK